MIHMLGTDKVYEAIEIGRFTPEMKRTKELGPGEVGYFISNIKQLGDVRVGDTMTRHKGPKIEMLPGYRPPTHMVYADFFPTNAGDFESLREGLETLSLSDSSFSFEPVTSDALGFGFRCGFLGLLHMEIVQERLEREHDIDMIQTAPTVTYQIRREDGKQEEIHSPGQLPSPDKYVEILEPYARVNIMAPTEFIGNVMQIASDHRGTYVRQEHLSPTRVQLAYDIPLAELIYDFFDKLKSSTRGYGTLNYEISGFRGQRSRQAADPRQRQGSRRALDDHARGSGRIPRPLGDQEDEEGDSSPPLRDRAAGRDRRAHRRARDDLRAAQGRHREVLRRRHHPQAQAAREAEGREAADAPDRQRRHPAEGLHGRARRRRGIGVAPAAVRAASRRASR
jgi:GTP-binding protein LepA